MTNNIQYKYSLYFHLKKKKTKLYLKYIKQNPSHLNITFFTFNFTNQTFFFYSTLPITFIPIPTCHLTYFLFMHVVIHFFDVDLGEMFTDFKKSKYKPLNLLLILLCYYVHVFFETQVYHREKTNF